MMKKTIKHKKYFRNIPLFLNVSSKGFTLVEMLIVLAIVTVVATAGMMMLSSGLDIWQRSLSFNVDHDLRIFVDKLKHDLATISKYENIRIRGTGTELSFPYYASAEYDPPWTDEEQGELRQINELSYQYEDIRDVVNRSSRKLYEKDFSTQTVLRDVLSFRFSYFYRKNNKELIKEYPDLPEGVIPKFVKVKVRYLASDKNQKEFSEILEVPLVSGVVL